MQLPGRLGATTLGDLLGALHRARASGVLRLTEERGPSAGRRHEVCLRSGLVADVVTAVPSPRIGDILRARGVIDEQMGEGAASAASRHGWRFGRAVRHDPGVSPTEVSRALRAQIRARLESLFRLSDARVTFHVATPREPDAPIPLLAAEFLHGRPRRRRNPSSEPSRAEFDADSLRALDVLGLRRGSTVEDVRRAFRLLARRCHPDCAKGADATRFAEISAAYHRLMSRPGFHAG